MAQATWHNRIVGQADVDPASLLANSRNFRIHPKHQKDALAGVIAEVGYIDPVKVQAGTDVVLDGHLRVSLALQQGIATIPVLYVDVNDDEANLILATFDPISALAATDTALLEDLLREVRTGDAAVQQMLSTLAEDNGVIPPDTFDPNAEWVGMPEFEQDSIAPIKQIIVSFHKPEDVAEFGRRLGQNVTMQTKGITFPPTRATFHTSAYVEAGDAA